MNTYSLSHLTDRALLRDLVTLVAKDRATTAALLAHIAEVDTRKLYLPESCDSMYTYCVTKLALSEASTLKRIRAARTAREFPAIFATLADGRLHLSAVVLLKSRLTPENADELVAAAAHKTKAEIEQLLAHRFPRADLPVRVQALSPPLSSAAHQLAPGPVDPHAPGSVECEHQSKLAPLSPQRFALQVTIGQDTHDKLRYAQELLSHQLPSGDVAKLLDKALDVLIRHLEKRKFAATWLHMN